MSMVEYETIDDKNTPFDQETKKDDLMDNYCFPLDGRSKQIIILISEIEELLGFKNDGVTRFQDLFQYCINVDKHNLVTFPLYTTEVGNYVEMLRKEKNCLEGIKRIQDLSPDKFNCCLNTSSKGLVNRGCHLSHSYTNHGKSSADAVLVRNRLPHSALVKLRKFLKTNQMSYPSQNQIEDLVRDTKLSESQVRNWFGNYRKRNKKVEVLVNGRSVDKSNYKQR